MSNTTAFALTSSVAEELQAGWAAERKAKVSVADDPAHALDLLTAGQPGGCAVVVFYLSDAPDGDEFSEDTRVNAQLRIGVVQHPGMAPRDGRQVPTVLALADSVRTWAAAQSFDILNGGSLRYLGMTPIPAAQGSVLHGYALTFEAVYAYEITED